MNSAQTSTMIAAIVLVLAIVPHSTLGRSLAATEEVAQQLAHQQQQPQQQPQQSRLLSVIGLRSEPDAQHNRQRRQTYNVPSSDYYSNYYNDYYNNYYNNQNGFGNNYPSNNGGYSGNNSPYRPASADRFDGNSNGNSINSLDSGNGFASDGRPQQQTINGQKYVYTPLFQYKATQGHHQKLFVPNLFG